MAPLLSLVSPRVLAIVLFAVLLIAFLALLFMADLGTASAYTKYIDKG